MFYVRSGAPWTLFNEKEELMDGRRLSRREPLRLQITLTIHEELWERVRSS